MVKAVTWEERALGNIFIRKMKFKNAGDVMEGHAHNFDHTTIVFTGSIKVEFKRSDGTSGERIYHAPKKGKPVNPQDGYVLVRADTEHKITALEDYTEAWCVFAHRDEHGEVVQKYEGIGLCAYV